MSKLEQTYRELGQKLKEGGNPRLLLDRDLCRELATNWQQALENWRPEQIIKLLCLLQHSQNLVSGMDALYWKTLSHPEADRDTLVLTLGVLLRHILARCQQSGERPPMELVNILKNLLSHPELEVFEWCLRTIEEMGPMGVLLREQVLQRRLGLARYIHPRTRACAKMVRELNARWR